jgi:hypothetical protein
VIVGVVVAVAVAVVAYVFFVEGFIGATAEATVGITNRLVSVENISTLVSINGERCNRLLEQALQTKEPHERQ